MQLGAAEMETHMRGDHWRTAGRDLPHTMKAGRFFMVMAAKWSPDVKAGLINWGS